jgi:hypothetical protein
MILICAVIVERERACYLPCFNYDVIERKNILNSTALEDVTPPATFLINFSRTFKELSKN